MTEIQSATPFVAGIEEFLSSMLQSSCEVWEGDCPEPPRVSSLISLAGDLRADLVLSFPQQTATRIVAQMLAIEEHELDDEMLGDGVGEIANIVAGRAKALLVPGERPYAVSLPSVVHGPVEGPGFREAKPTIARRITTDLGEFSLAVWVSRPDAQASPE